MNHIAGQPKTQAAAIQPAVWYNYDVIMNQPLQLQVISAAPQTTSTAPTANHIPIPSPSSTPAPSQTPVPGTICTIPVKSEKVKKTSSGGTERIFSCDLCSATFTNSSNFNIHKKIHWGIKSYVCSLCGKDFIQHSNLKAHERIHTGERPYKCSECGRAFSRSSHLIGHKRTHTGEKPYICSICGEAFYMSSHMKNHVRRHTGEKPYVCQECGEAFSQSSALKIHIRRHKGEKAFNCSECNTAFFTLPELRSHRKATGCCFKPYKCENCNRCFQTLRFCARHQLKCSGPRPKRPKGRPPKYPRDNDLEPPWAKKKIPRNRKPAAPTDRVTRSKYRTSRIAQVKEVVKVEDDHSSKDLMEVVSTNTDLKKSETMHKQANDILVDSSSAGLPSGSSSKDSGLHESEEHMSQLPVVHVMLDNFSSGGDEIVLHSVPGGPLHGMHSLTDENDQLGVMDLSGQQIHETEHQSDNNVQTTMSMRPTQSMSVVAADNEMPLMLSQYQQVSIDHQILPAVVNQHGLNNQQKLPVATSFHQPVSASPLLATSSVTTADSISAIPQVSAHHLTSANMVGQVSSSQNIHIQQQQLTVASTYKQSSAVSTYHQVPAVSAHHHLPSVTASNSTASSHLHLPTISAHQNQVGVGVDQQATSLTANIENTVTAHQNLTMTSNQQISSVSGHQMLPVVSAHQQQQLSPLQLSTTATTPQLPTGLSHHHAVNSHHHLPIVSAHQPTINNHLQLPTVSSRHSLPTILTAHQSSNSLQQHLVAVTAHQSVSSVPQQHLSTVTAHQEAVSATDQQIAVAHLSNNSNVHQQGLVVSAHQQQVVSLVPVYKHSCNLENSKNSQVVYEGGQSFVVDLSSPALTPQVSLFDSTVTSHSTRH